jgi:hypothetical protein
MKLQILVVVVVRRLSKVFIFATSVLVSKLDSFTYLVCGCNVMVMFPKMNPDSIVLLSIFVSFLFCSVAVLLYSQCTSEEQ